MTPAMVATARALAKVWDGPPLVEVLVQTGPYTKVPLIDLTSGPGGLANVGPLYMALDNATPKAVHFYSLADGYEVSWHNESIEGQDYVAEALALAFLAVSR